MQKHIFETSFLGLQIAPSWYGLMYVLGFTFCYFFMKRYARLRQDELDSLLTYIFFGVVGGGRIGYVILYNFEYFMMHPLEILKVWEGGMSFHGGLVGVLLALFFFARQYKLSYFTISDPLAICLPVALGFGRIGNWINGELPGYTPYDGIFPMMINSVNHFPSPLLAVLLEGIVLFIWLLYFWKRYDLLDYGRKGTVPGLLSVIFLIGYSISRLIGEIFRLPDSHIGYLFGTSWLTLGILYTLPMLLLGIYLLDRHYLARKWQAQ